ncbi:MAG: ABC transporter permease [Actinomycetia bacterium]|nr:ABC transporter permease [Actinomycetes bacterium]
MRKLRSILIYARTQIRRTFRDRSGVFFTVFFPLIFLLIFGTIYGNNSGSTNFNIALINQSQSAFAKQFDAQIRKNDTFKVIAVKDLADAKKKMDQGSLDSIVVLPASFGQVTSTSSGKGALAQRPARRPNNIPGAKSQQGAPPLRGRAVVYYSKASPTGGQTVASVISGALAAVNARLIGTPPLTVQQKPIDTGDLSAFSYLFSGLFAFSLMSMTVFGLSQQLPAEKKTGALRRLEVTPFAPWQLILGSVLAYLVLTIVSATLFSVVATTFFGFQMQGSWLTLAVFALFSSFVMAGLGMIVAGWARSQQQATPITMAIAFPLMFLSGVFIPRFLMPGWLQKIGGLLPMSPIVEGVRYITTQNYSLIKLAPQLGMLAIWAVVAYVVAFLVFRWE